MGEPAASAVPDDDLYHGERRWKAPLRSVRHLARIVEQIYVSVKSAEEVRRLVAAASRKGYHEVEVGCMTCGQELLKQGSLRQSQDVLARQLSRKFGLTDAQRERIIACDDQSALDAALDGIIDADSKSVVLARLPQRNGPRQLMASHGAGTPHCSSHR